jgi:hypothetical protein
MDARVFYQRLKAYADGHCKSGRRGLRSLRRMVRVLEHRFARAREAAES